MAGGLTWIHSPQSILCHIFFPKEERRLFFLEIRKKTVVPKQEKKLLFPKQERRHFPK